MKLLWICLIGVLATCAPRQDHQNTDPLMYRAHMRPHMDVDHIVVGIPGALTSIDVLRPLDHLARPGRAVVYYRLPGFDGRPNNEALVLDQAAQRIARLVTRHKPTRIDLIGHSTGAAIALEAAKLIRTAAPKTQVHVTGISTALPAPQPVLAGLRGASGTLAAAMRARSLTRRDVWLEYYRHLAFGRDVDKHPETAQAADALVAQNADRITLPNQGLFRRHTRDLRRWKNPNPSALLGASLSFFHGDVDPVFPSGAVTRFVKTLPQADLHIIKGHGHLILLTYPDLWDHIQKEIEAP